MQLDLLFSPLEIARCHDVQNDPTTLKNKTSIIIDVLRASTTMVYAFNGFDNEDANTLQGVKMIIPAKNVNTARELYRTLDKTEHLLAGELEGLPPEDFHLGNSPADFTQNEIFGKSIVMATTNGTKTLNLCLESKAILIGSFVNAFASAYKAINLQNDIVIVCAGRKYVSSIEDITAGGLISLYLKDLAREMNIDLTLSDGAKAAIRLYQSYRSIMDILKDSYHGQFLIDNGLEKDLEHCAIENLFNIVPFYENSHITAEVIQPLVLDNISY